MDCKYLPFNYERLFHESMSCSTRLLISSVTCYVHALKKLSILQNKCRYFLYNFYAVEILIEILDLSSINSLLFLNLKNNQIFFFVFSFYYLYENQNFCSILLSEIKFGIWKSL